MQTRYCPVVLILGPGELLHINKGRLHAFRKLDLNRKLPETDCHHEMRLDMKGKLKQDSASKPCMSIAWDYNYIGISARGRANSMLDAFRSERRNSYNADLSLGSGGYFRYNYANSVLAQMNENTGKILPGICLSLQYLLQKMKLEETIVQEHMAHPQFIPLATKVKFEEVKEEPYFSGKDYTCGFCNGEIISVFMQCEKCELLGEDLYTCAWCIATKRCSRPMGIFCQHNYQGHKKTARKRVKANNHMSPLRGWKLKCRLKSKCVEDILKKAKNQMEKDQRAKDQMEKDHEAAEYKERWWYKSCQHTLERMLDRKLRQPKPDEMVYVWGSPKVGVKVKVKDNSKELGDETDPIRLLEKAVFLERLDNGRGKVSIAGVKKLEKNGEDSDKEIYGPDSVYTFENWRIFHQEQLQKN